MKKVQMGQLQGRRKFIVVLLAMGIAAWAPDLGEHAATVLCTAIIAYNAGNIGEHFAKNMGGIQNAMGKMAGRFSRASAGDGGPATGDAGERPLGP